MDNNYGGLRGEYYDSPASNLLGAMDPIEFQTVTEVTIGTEPQ